MKLKKDDEQKLEERITKLANKGIKRREQQTGRKADNKEIAIIFKKAEQTIKQKEKKKKLKKKKIRNMIIGALGLVGISIAGYELLTDGNEPKVPSQHSTETTKKEKEHGNKNKDYRETMKVEANEMLEQNDTSYTLVDEILEKYNSKLTEENKIEKEDLRNNSTRKYGRRTCYKKCVTRWKSKL